MKAAPGLCGGKCGSEAPAQVANGTDHAVGGHRAVVDRGQGAVDLVTLGLALLGFEGQLLGSILALATVLAELGDGELCGFLVAPLLDGSGIVAHGVVAHRTAGGTARQHRGQQHCGDRDEFFHEKESPVN